MDSTSAEAGETVLFKLKREMGYRRLGIFIFCRFVVTLCVLSYNFRKLKLNFVAFTFLVFKGIVRIFSRYVITQYISVHNPRSPTDRRRLSSIAGGSTCATHCLGARTALAAHCRTTHPCRAPRLVRTAIVAGMACKLAQPSNTTALRCKLAPCH